MKSLGWAALMAISVFLNYKMPCQFEDLKENCERMPDRLGR